MFEAPPNASFRFGLVLNAASSSAEDPTFQTVPVKVGLEQRRLARPRQFPPDCDAALTQPCVTTLCQPLQGVITYNASADPFAQALTIPSIPYSVVAPVRLQLRMPACHAPAGGCIDLPWQHDAQVSLPLAGLRILD